MTLQTTKTHKGKAWTCETAFDPDLLAGKIEIDKEENLILFHYMIQDIPELYPPNTTGTAPLNCARITGDSIYWQTLYGVPEGTEANNALKKHISYFLEAPEIELNVKLTEQEKNRFLLAILKKIIKGEIEV